MVCFGGTGGGVKSPLQCIFTKAVFKLSAWVRDLVLGALKWHRLPVCTRFLLILRESTALLFHTSLLHLRFKITFDREKCVHSCISGTKAVNTMSFSASTRRQWARKPSSLRAVHTWCSGTSAWVPAQNGVVFTL